MASNAITTSRSNLAERLIQLDGKCLCYDEYPFMRRIVNLQSKSVCLKCSRQVGKSIYNGSDMILNSITGINNNPNEPFLPFKSLYIAPLQEQTLKFSNTKLGKMISFSPYVSGLLTGAGDVQNVLLKVFKNGSDIALQYALDDPDRVRGITADKIYFDEVQDMNYSAVVPVIKECSANSDLGWVTFTGTPKTFENAIETKWQRGTQEEWVMLCGGCGKYDFIDSEKNIGIKGPICKGCGHLLNPGEGKWVAMNPKATEHSFHVSAPMLLRNTTVPGRWHTNILSKLNDPIISLSTFRNEVIGVSDSIGTRLVGIDDLRALCSDYSISENITPDTFIGVNKEFISAGVDWSGQGNDMTSYTALWIWGPMASTGKLKCLLYKLYPQGNPVEAVEDIVMLCDRFEVRKFVGDAGEGALANALVRKRLGDYRCIQVQHGMFRRPVEWNGKDRYLLDRTTVIDNFMMELKNQTVIFPIEEQATTAFSHILAEYEETITSVASERKVWRHSPSAPDDILQAAIYGWIGFKILAGGYKFYDYSG